MSSLLTSDEAPFVFGAYATHLNEASPDAVPESEAEVSLPEQPLPLTAMASTMPSLLDS